MSRTTPRRARVSIRLGIGAFGLIALILVAVLGRTSIRQLVTGDRGVTSVDASDAQRAVRFGPRRVGGGSTVGLAIGGVAEAPGLLSLDDAALDQQLGAIQSAGATWIRFDFLWPSIEPQDGQWNWHTYDRVVAAVQSHGLKVLGLLAYTPPWARPAGCTTTDKCPPGDLAAWQQFVTTTVDRYKASVSHWEVWNEPNLRGFWATGPDPAAYAQLLKATYPAVKQADPNAMVVTGGLAPAETRDAERYPIYDFAVGMFANGIHGSFDALGIHPYTYPFVPADAFPYNNYFNLGKYYDLMVANGDSDKQVWSTEAGAPTGTYVGADRRAVSEATQAIVAQQIYEIAAKRPWQGPVFWFCFRDYGPDLGDIEQNFGLLHNDGTPKPSYDAFVAAMQIAL